MCGKLEGRKGGKGRVRGKCGRLAKRGRSALKEEGRKIRGVRKRSL